VNTWAWQSMIMFSLVAAGDRTPNRQVSDARP
jgi:hypothetical protein